MAAPGPGGEGGGGSGWEGWEKDEGRRALEVYHENVLFHDADDDTDADTITGAQPPVTQRKYRRGSSMNDPGSVKTHETYPLRHLLNKKWIYGSTVLCAALAATTGSVFLVQWTKERQGKVISSSLMTLEDTISLPSVYDNFGDVAGGYLGDDGPDKPLIWDVHGNGNVVETVVAKCLKKTVAGPFETDEAQPFDVVSTKSGSYVNLYLGTPSGIKKAANASLAADSSTNVVSSPLVYEVGKMFTQENRAKCVAMFPHPIHRVAMIHHAVKEVDDSMKDLTLLEFIETPQGSYNNNWMTRELSGGVVGTLDEEHFLKARAVLRQKCLIGLADEEHVHESLERFEKYFGWDIASEDEAKYDKCVSRVLNKRRVDQLNFNLIEEGSDEWNVTKGLNEWDVRLYDFLTMLYNEQPYDLGWEETSE